MGKFEDLTGRKFGRLTVIERMPTVNRRTRWKCICDCGTEKVVGAEQLKSGTTRSCGCYHSDRTREAHYKHGMSNHHLFRIWADMWKRCTNKNNKAYKHYGGRGITVCDEWLEFQPFYDWAISHGWSEGLTIDRINPDMDYSPDNCRWATWKVQQNNKRNNRYLTFNGRTQTLTQWAEELGMSEDALSTRINQHGWSVEKSLTTPVRQAERMITFNGKTQSVTQWAEELGMNKTTLTGRIYDYGWTIERAFTTPVQRHTRH